MGNITRRFVTPGGSLPQWPAVLLLGLGMLTASAGAGTPPPAPRIAIAVVPFAGGRELTDVAQIVGADLARSGRFDVVDRAKLPETPAMAKDFHPGRWRDLGVANVLIGTTRQLSSSQASVHFELLDAATGAAALTLDLPPALPEQLRYSAHQVADQVFHKLTGIPGASNTKIVYVVRDGADTDRRYALTVSDFDGENPRTLAIAREPMTGPSWSPDRKRLAYVGYVKGQPRIFVHELATGVARVISAEAGLNSAPAWSPDGTQIALVLDIDGSPDVYLLNMATKERTRLTNGPGVDTEPSWSPDGKSIVFTSDRSGTPQLWRVAASGGEPTQVTKSATAAFNPHWSPDGRSVAYVRVDDAGSRIALIDLESGVPCTISAGPQDSNPSWSPNGQEIVYDSLAPAGNGSALSMVSVDGAVRKRFAAKSGDAAHPAWSPNLGL